MPPAFSCRYSSTPSLRRAVGTILGTALVGTTGSYAQISGQAAAPEPVQLSPLTVQGGEGSDYQTDVPALRKLTQPLLDTPQSIGVVPKQLMQDQGDAAVRDALRNVPGISLGAGEAGAQGDNLTLRGFSDRNDFYLDGMRDYGSYTRDPFDLESIEVLKGPAADVGRPIEGLQRSGLRLNLMGNLNGVTGRDDAEYRQFGVAPSAVFGLGTDTRLTIDHLHQQEYDTPDYGLPWLYSVPANVSRGNFYGSGLNLPSRSARQPSHGVTLPAR